MGVDQVLDQKAPYEATHEGVKSDPELSDGEARDDTVETNFQAGVQDVEAMTIEWGKSALISALVLIWFVYFIQGFVSNITGALLPYVTSSFATHSLTATTGVVSSVVGGVTNMSIAKILDVFGRPQGFAFCAILATLGLIMCAACNNVEAYAASQVFYTVGINGIGYSLTVFIADVTTLQNRGLVQALCASSTLITAWLGGPISTAFLNGAGWRWAFGMETILVPAITAPLFALFMFHYLKAKKKGLVPERSSGRMISESIGYYATEFDIVGLFLLSAGVAFFLLPFNLYAQQAKGWGSAIVISFLVVGVVLLIAFGIWEKYFATKSFIPWFMLQDRTVIGSCLLSFCLFFSYGAWGLYFSSILQVVNGLTVTEASYIIAEYNVVAFFFAILVGALMSKSGRFQPVTLYAAVPLSILGTGLLIHFKEPDGKIGYIVMSVLFMGIGSGTIMLTVEIAMLAAVKEQQYFAVAIAFVSMCSSIGSAVGFTASAAIWQDVFPKALAKYLPPEELPNLLTIQMDIVTQMSFPAGSAASLAIKKSYGEGQNYLFIAATAIWVLGIVGALMWKNVNIKGVKQTKGRVI